MGFLPDTQNYRLRKRWECRERFPRHRGLAIPTCITDHGTYVTHVPWCMPESLTTGFLWSRCRGKRSRHSRHMRNPQFCVSGKRPMVVRRHDPIIVDVNAAVPLAQKHVMTSCHFNYCDSVLSLDSWTCRIIPADLCGGWCVGNPKWVRTRNCGCLVTWFCYHLIAKPGNKTDAVSWPDPNTPERYPIIFSWFTFRGWKQRSPPVWCFVLTLCTSSNCFYLLLSAKGKSNSSRNSVLYIAATKQLYEWYFLSVCLSVCPSVRHTFLTMFLSSYHHEIFRSYHQGPG